MQPERKIILASSSPRRRELLAKIGLKFRSVAGNYAEDSSQALSPEQLVKANSLGKALSVVPRFPDAIIIAADTIGVIGDRIIGKPRHEEQAREMLQLLSGASHTVITGYTILDTRSRRTRSRTVKTRVYIKKMSPGEIEDYVQSGEPLGKAGAYAIQGLGAVIVQKITGDYYNVMGLPLSSLAKSLKAFGIHVL